MRTVTGKDFEQQIAEQLRKADIPFKMNVPIGGLQIDFLISTPKGRSIVIEAVSAPTMFGETQRRVINRVAYYKQATGADNAYIVLKDLKASSPQSGLLCQDDVVGVVSAEIQKDSVGQDKAHLNAWRMKQSKGTVKQSQGLIFAAMPFSPDYDDTFYAAMVPAAKKVGAICTRVDQEKFIGDIVGEIGRLIRASRVVIADLSEANPNVYFEAGFAHALSLPVIHICSAVLHDLPFDVRNVKTIRYSKGQTHKLVGPLAQILKSILQGN
jgi:hypothetical protein